VFFVGAHAGIIHTQGYVSCVHCTFLDVFTSALITRLAVYDPYVYISMYDQHFVNTLYQYAYQLGDGSPLVAPELSAGYVDRSLLVNSQTYMMALSTTQLWGTEGCPTCTTCESSPCYSKYINIALVVLLALSIVINVIACISRSRTYSKK
jgi:hypothetical protein